MQQLANEFLTWLGMTYAGTFVVLTIIELVTKKKRKKECLQTATCKHSEQKK